MFTSSRKRVIRQFHVVVVQSNVQKAWSTCKVAVLPKISPYSFCRSRCRRRRLSCLLHDYDVKVPKLKFGGGHEGRTTALIFFSLTSLQSLRIHFQKNCQHLTTWSRWKKRDKFGSSANSLFRWRFLSRRRRCCLSHHLFSWYNLVKFEVGFKKHF